MSWKQRTKRVNNSAFFCTLALFATFAPLWPTSAFFVFFLNLKKTHFDIFCATLANFVCCSDSVRQTTNLNTEPVKYTLISPVKLDNTDLLPSTVTRLPLIYSCLGHDTQIFGKRRQLKIAKILFPCFSLQVLIRCQVRLKL